MEWRYHWPADDDSDCVLLLVWCVVWELKSVLCSIRFRHNCVLCCDDVYWWNGMLWQCAGVFVVGVLVHGVDTVYVFWSYWGHVFWCGLVVFEKFVVVSAGWDIRVGCRAWGALVCLVFCVLIVFCFVSSSLFFWELWDHAAAATQNPNRLGCSKSGTRCNKRAVR